MSEYNISSGGSDSILFHPGVDGMLDTLSNRHRRVILLSLRENPVKTVADVMFRGEKDIEEAEFELVHEHLPKLEEAGYIEWDRESGEIKKGPNFDEIAPIIELLDKYADELPPGWP